MASCSLFTWNFRFCPTFATVICYCPYNVRRLIFFRLCHLCNYEMSKGPEVFSQTYIECYVTYICIYIFYILNQSNPLWKFCQSVYLIFKNWEFCAISWTNSYTISLWVVIVNRTALVQFWEVHMGRWEADCEYSSQEHLCQVKGCVLLLLLSVNFSTLVWASLLLLLVLCT